MSVILPFTLYCVYYYGMMIKNAPYKFSEFTSIVLNYGTGDSLANKFNTKTGYYQYLNSRDSLVKMHLRFTKDDLLYLHRKAADLGFWDFPSHMLGDTGKNSKAPHYYIEFNYKRKSKRVYYDADFGGKPELKDAAQRLIKEIQTKEIEVEKR